MGCVVCYIKGNSKKFSVEFMFVPSFLFCEFCQWWGVNRIYREFVNGGV